MKDPHAKEDPIVVACSDDDRKDCRSRWWSTRAKARLVSDAQMKGETRVPECELAGRARVDITVQRRSRNEIRTEGGKERALVAQ